jgi:hypothetical protein
LCPTLSSQPLSPSIWALLPPGTCPARRAPPLNAACSSPAALGHALAPWPSARGPLASAGTTPAQPRGRPVSQSPEHGTPPPLPCTAAGRPAGAPAPRACRTTPELEPPRCSSVLPAGRPAYGRRARAERVAGVRGRGQSRAERPLSLLIPMAVGARWSGFLFLFFLLI